MDLLRGLGVFGTPQKTVASHNGHNKTNRKTCASDPNPVVGPKRHTASQQAAPRNVSSSHNATAPTVPRQRESASSTGRTERLPESSVPIQKQSGAHNGTDEKPDTEWGKSGEWNTVRIFVSSTFQDMHSERNSLVTRVFPVLRMWCEEHRLHLIACDLRWGVPKDSSTGDTLLTCLGELDRCSSSRNGSHPYFISILGERYGWVPTEDQVPAIVRHKYKWIPGLSVTAMEITHAALSSSDVNPNALFFFRDSRAIDTIPTEPESVRAQALSALGSDGSESKLSRLKEQIRNRYSVVEYSSTFDRIENGVVLMKGLDDFEKAVLTKLKSIISKNFVDSFPKTPSQLLVEPHACAISEMAKHCIGCESDVNLLFQALQDTNYILLDSDSGMGASTTLAALGQYIMKKHRARWSIFTHFSESGPHTKEVNTILTRLCLHFEGVTYLNKIQESHSDSLVHTLQHVIHKNRNKNRKTLILIDHVDKLSKQHHGTYDWWLPKSVPPNVKIVATVSERRNLIGDQSYNKESVLGCPWHRLPISGVSSLAVDQIAIQTMHVNAKSLDENQKSLLLSKRSSKNPLWLNIACGELVQFGIFEAVSEKIQSLPDSLPGLIESVLERLETQFGAKCVTDLLCLIAFSHNGLLENEAMELLGNPITHEPLCNAEWAPLRARLADFLCPSDATTVLSFTHTCFLDAVRKRYSCDRKEVANSYWTILANYHEEKLKSSKVPSFHERPAEELPYLFESLGDQARMAQCLSHLSVFLHWFTDETKFQFVQFSTAVKDTSILEKNFSDMVELSRLQLVSVPERVLLLFRVSEFFSYIGLLDASLKVAQQSVHLGKQVSHGICPEMGFALNMLARVQDQKGDSTSALDNFKLALQTRRRVYGREHIYIAHSLNNLAAFYQVHGKQFGASLPLYREALVMAQHILGETHPLVADFLSNIGQVYTESGNHDAAVIVLHKALTIRTQVQDDKDPSLSLTLTTLANALRGQAAETEDPEEKMHKFSQALSYYKQALNVDLCVYGERNVVVATDYCNIGSMYSELELDARTEDEMFAKAYEIRKALLGEEHEQTKAAAVLCGGHIPHPKSKLWDKPDSGSGGNTRQITAVAIYDPSTALIIQEMQALATMISNRPAERSQSDTISTTAESCFSNGLPYTGGGMPESPPVDNMREARRQAFSSGPKIEEVD